MRRASAVLAGLTLALGLTAGEQRAVAQRYIPFEQPGVFVPLASIPGVADLIPLTFDDDDEGWVNDVPIPFPFTYAGAARTTVHVNTNGFVSFTDGSGQLYTNDALGDASEPNAMIAALWDDLVIDDVAGATAGTVGTAPNRAFVIEVRGLEHYSGGDPDAGEVQFWFYEGITGRFEIRVRGPFADDYSATIGFEGTDGSPSHAFRACTPRCDAPDLNGLDGLVLGAELPASPELSGALEGFPRGAFPGTSTAGTIRLDNFGAGTATVVSSRLWISRDDRLDPGDTLVLTATAGPVRSGVPFNLPVRFTVPQLPIADYLLILEVDSDGVFIELDEDDNLVLAPSGFATGPDFAASEVSASAVGPASPITVSATIDNTALPIAGPLDLAVHASADRIWDAGDPLIARRTVTLAGLASEAISIEGAAAGSIPAGSFYAIVVVDPGDRAPEVNERNNIAVGAATFSSAPDFAIESIVVPDAIPRGTSGDVTIEVASGALPYTGTVDVELFASLDSVLDPRDLSLGTATVAFAGEDRVSQIRQVAIPAQLAAGRYRMIAVADPRGSLPETDERNNTGASSGTFVNATDLQVSDVEADEREGAPGGQITVRATIDAVDVPHAGVVGYRVLLSEDDELDPSDFEVHTATVTLRATGSTTIAATFTVPSRIPIVEVTPIVEVDPGHLVAEADETNNWQDSWYEIDLRGPDVLISDLAGAPVAFLGRPYVLRFTVSNIGEIDAAPFSTGVYLTLDDILAPDDVELLRFAPAPLAAGTSLTVTATVMLPAGTATISPRRWLGVIADPLDAIGELNESNNGRRIPAPLRIAPPTPDLVAEILETSTIASPGEPIAATRLVENRGAAPGQPIEIGWYLSVDPVITTADLPIGMGSAPAIAEGGAAVGVDLLVVPQDAPEGLYWLGLVLDPREVSPELDRTNDAALGPRIRVETRALEIRTRALAAGTRGVMYEAAIVALGGATSRLYSVSSGTLPPGLVLDPASGWIRGTPAVAGSYAFVARVESGRAFVEQPLSIAIHPPSGPLSVATTLLPAAIAGRPYDAMLAAAGGVPPFRWSPLTLLPGGLALAEDGRLTGTPPRGGIHRLRFAVVDETGARAEGDVALNIFEPNQTVRIVQLPLPPGALGAPYCEPDQVTLAARGGIEPYRWSLIGEPPPGLMLSDAGTLCGTPLEIGRWPVLVRVTDSAGLSDTSLFLLDVGPGPAFSIVTPRLPRARAGEAYSARIAASGGTQPFVITIAEGSLPPGLVLAPSGEITGTPSTEGAAALVFTAQDAEGRRAARALSIVVDPAPSTGEDGGCSCRTERSGSTSPWALALLASLVSLALRTRRRVLVLLSAAVVVSSSAAALAQPAENPYQVRYRRAAYQPLANPEALITPPADTTRESVPLPFTFRFYESDVTEVTVSTNGAILLEPDGYVSDSNATPGSTSSPDGWIAPFWDDLVINAAGAAVSQEVRGVAPARSITFEWRDADRYGASGTPHMSFQLTLHEGIAGRITIAYGPVGASMASFSGTMAMEDPAGERPILFDRTEPPCTTSCTLAPLTALSGWAIDVTQDAGPDLAAASIESPEVGYLGAAIPVRVAIASLHRNPLGPFIFDVLATRAADPTAPPISFYRSQPITLSGLERREMTVPAVPPLAFPEGEVRLSLAVDTSSVVPDVDQSNDSLVSASLVRLFPARADLAVSGVRITGLQRTRTSTPGAPIRVVGRVENRGGVASTGARVVMVLSTNAAISPRDLELAYSPAALEPGEAITATLSASIPAATPSGRYFVGLFADPDLALGESNESNNGAPDFEPVVIDAGGLAIATEMLPEARVGRAYLAQLSALGGTTGRYGWALTAGALPPGLALDARGAIFGEPARDGTHSFTVTASTAGRASVSRELSIRVTDPALPLTILTQLLLPGRTGEEYSTRLSAAGGATTSTAAHVWSARDLPQGLALSPGGVIAGVPARAGTSSISVDVSDGMASANATLVLIVRDPERLSLDTRALPEAVLDRTFTAMLAATGGVPPLMFTGEGLPEGLRLSPDGVFSGSPQRAGAFRVRVVVSDSGPPGLVETDEAVLDLVVRDPGGFSIATASLPAMRVGEPVQLVIETQGGAAPIVWKIVQGGLPRGLAADLAGTSATLRILGTPEEVETRDLWVSATDARGQVASRAFVIDVAARAVPTPEDTGCSCSSSPRAPASSLALAALLISLCALRRRRRA